MKDYQFHYTHRYVKDSTEIKTLFSIEYKHIWGITNGDVKSRRTYEPSEIIALEKQLHADFKAGLITNLWFGRSVIVNLFDEIIKIKQS